MGLLIFPVFAKIASAAILDQATSARVELQFALSKWRSFLWIAFLKTAAQLLIPEALTFGVIILVAIIEYAAGAFDNKGNPILVALVLFSPILGGLALFAWVSCCLSLAVPIAALEPFTGLKALTRSWKLTRDGRLRILTAAFALSIFGAGLAIGFRLLLASITEILFFHGKSTEFFDRPLYLFVDDLLSALLAALTGPLYPIAITLFHYDQRIRREGFDIDWMMQRAGLVVPTPPQQEAQPADDPQHHLHQDAPPPAQPQLGVPQ
jgi:hypothetical protein